MARQNGDWITFSMVLVVMLQVRPEPNPEITKTIEEIKADTGTRMTIDSLRDRGYWRACRKGKPSFDTCTKAGLELEEHLDSRRKVVSVTFRLAHVQASV